MATADHAGERLLVALSEGKAYVRVEGRGTFKCSGNLKQFGFAAIEKKVKQFILDMERCTGMDSTFMGVLAGLARSLTKEKGKMVAVNLDEKVLSLLTTLGLDHVIDGHMAGDTPKGIVLPASADEGLTPLPQGEESRRETAEIMMEAHENLVELSPENYPRFKDVLTFIREDMEAATEQQQGKDD